MSDQSKPRVTYDPHLQRLVRAAEEGHTCPQVTVLLGGWVASGVPVTKAKFLNASYSDIALRRSASKEVMRSFGTPGERDQAAHDLVMPLMATFDQPEDQADGACPAWHLTEVTVMGPQDAGFKTAAIRIPLEHVLAWWVSFNDVVSPKAGPWFGIVVST